jgi:hypothetical protein
MAAIEPASQNWFLRLSERLAIVAIDRGTGPFVSQWCNSICNFPKLA